MSAKLRILYVAYPLACVSLESAGGAEQMLYVVEREMFLRGHATTVAACMGSQITGDLFPTGRVPCQPDRFAQRNAEHTARVLEFLRCREKSTQPFDLVHDKSGTFWPNAGEVDVPVLATLHLPRGFYSPHMFENIPPNVFFNCVSESQARWFSDLPNDMGVVRNGIRLEQFSPGTIRGDYLLWVGRFCYEKGAHLAIQAAQCAGLPLVLAGQIYPFSHHQEYFEREIAPYLNTPAASVSYVDSPTADQKRTLLQNARAVLVPSIAEETSSLITMEASASGTPVIAFNRGALPEVVAEGVTGFVGDSVQEMAAKVSAAGLINPAACRRHAELHYSSKRMAAEYERLYAAVTRAAEFRGLAAA